MRRALPALLLIALAGCGGSDDDGLSAAEYRKQANKLCRQSERVADRLPEAKAPDELDELFERILEVTKPYDRRLDALVPPAELRARHERAVREGDRQERYVRGLVQDLRRSDDPIPTLRKEFPKLLKMVDRSNALARSLGVDDCVEELTPPGSGAPGTRS